MKGQKGRPRAIIVHGYSHHFAGSERVALSVAEAYRDSGMEVSMWLPSEGPFAERTRQAGYPVEIQPTGIEAWRRPHRWLSRPMAAVRRTQRRRPTVLHATSASPIPCLLPAARLSGARLVAQLQTVYQPSCLRRALVEHSDLLLPVSPAAAAPAQAHLEGRRQRPRLKVLMPALNEPTPGDLDRATVLAGGWRRHPDELLVGVAGQIIPRKGLTFFLQACHRVLASGYRIRPVIIGSAPPGEEEYRNHLRALVRQFGLIDDVIFTDFTDQMPAHLGALDVLAVPSLAEGLGTVAGEAQLCGTTVVASNVGGLPCMVQDDETGLLVPPGNPEALAAALMSLAGAPRRRTELALAGRQRALREHGQNQFREQLLQLVVP